MWAAIAGYDSLIVMLLSANVMYEMLCTNNKCINIEYYYNFI